MRDPLGLRVERVHRPEYGVCVRIADGIAELLVAVDYGPRVLYYALAEGPNVMFNNRDPGNVKRGEAFDEVFYPGAYWDIYGGNRLWVSPHSYPRAFYPDHDPVEVEPLPDGAIFRAPPQAVNEVQNSVEIRMAEGRVALRYCVRNVGKGIKRLGAWAVTAVAPGGLELIPQPRLSAGVLPNRRLALWDYTAMRDERLFWGNDYIALRQDPSEERPVKLGINNAEGWACYLNEGHCFLLRHPHEEGADYPDFGVSYETYAHDRMLELESLSPLSDLEPGASVEHREEWELFPAPAPRDWRDELALAGFVEAHISGRIRNRPFGLT